MRMLDRDNFMVSLYPLIQRRKKFGTLSHQKIFSDAEQLEKNVNLLSVRLDIQQFLRNLSPKDRPQDIDKARREIWKKEQTIWDFCRVVVKAALDPKVDPKFGDFLLVDTFRIQMMRQKREYKLAAIDQKTNTHGFIVVIHKKMLKEAVFKAMEDLRFLARARNTNNLYAFATNVYEWQLIYYSRDKELRDEKDFFQVTEIFKLFYKDQGYNYGEVQLKKIITLMRCLTLYIHDEMQSYHDQNIVGYNCIDNLDEVF